MHNAVNHKHILITFISFIFNVGETPGTGCTKFLLARAVAGGCKSQARRKMLICHSGSVSDFYYIHVKKFRFTHVGWSKAGWYWYFSSSSSSQIVPISVDALYLISMSFWRESISFSTAVISRWKQAPILEAMSSTFTVYLSQIGKTSRWQ